MKKKINKYARTKRAKILFFIVIYANLWDFCCRRRRGCLRANVGIYRESQISSEKSNFGLYHPNNPLVWLFQKIILKNPQALCIWIILEKFENSQKNTIFIHEISHNFERFQRNSTGANDLLLTSSSSHI